MIRSSVAPLNKEEINSEDIRAMKNEFTQELNKRLPDVVLDETSDTLNYDKYSVVNDSIPHFVPYEDDESEFNTGEGDEEEEEIQFDKHMMKQITLLEGEKEHLEVLRAEKGDRTESSSESIMQILFWTRQFTRLNLKMAELNRILQIKFLRH